MEYGQREGPFTPKKEKDFFDEDLPGFSCE
jgi:hypothetical protein